MTFDEAGKAMLRVTHILKKRFPNMQAQDAIEISSAILAAILEHDTPTK